MYIITCNTTMCSIYVPQVTLRFCFQTLLFFRNGHEDKLFSELKFRSFKIIKTLYTIATIAYNRGVSMEINPEL